MFVMQPTVPPWWSQQRRVLLPRAHYRAHNIHFNWSRPRTGDITLYFERDDPARIFSRFEDALSQSRLFPTRIPWRDRYPLDMDLWRQPLPTPPDLKPNGAGGAVSAPNPTPSMTWWQGAARGWLVGTLLLAVLMLIMLVMEKILDSRLFKIGRRRSEEWHRPNVLATSGQQTSNIDIRLENSDVFLSESPQGMSNDLPPPYSECANSEVSATDADSSKLVITDDEPPPPYSACYVAFLNPKDGTPSVHLHSRRPWSFSNSSTSADTTYTVASNGNIRDSSVATANSEFNSLNIANANAELVFENGRVIERTECATDLINNGNVQLNTILNTDSNNVSTDRINYGNEHVINM